MGGRLIAVLGPTNTGKTHLAMERMLGHRSGMIGFPLRLLARENYDRVVAAKGAASVALLTGEEKIIPPAARWFICTVEAMPLNRRVDFLAIDEIQLAADAERGHVFTDRLLHARGETETMVLGAETIRPLLRRLAPSAEFVSRPRFSQLTYTGQRKLTRLPPRSAIVAFSATEVYGLAELIRRQRGGAAVVLGALSPRTRNAQVGLYQAGEVDYLVATDAIGMGLNMDIDHVAFAALRKFDGRAPRDLTAAEVAQIAGRAGRHMNDGSFGTTGDIGGFEPALADAVENHSFPPLQRLQWRNSQLVFTSVGALQASLNRLPDQPGLIRARDADDQLVLQAVLRNDEAAGRASSAERVRLLWEICQIPDFRKAQAEQHSRLVAVIFGHLSAPPHCLPADWLDAQVKRVDRVDGDIDTLMTRIANVRTWTYVSHRADWVGDARHWQERTRDIEDRLSDALHQRLAQRFIDRRTAVLVRKLKDGGDLLSAVDHDGEVKVEGHFVGRLDGFRFQADAADGASATRAVSAAAQKALKQEIAGRIRRAADDADEVFTLDDQGLLRWREAPVANLAAGPETLRPTVALLPSDLVEGASRTTLQRRLDTWLADYLLRRLAPLSTIGAAAVSGPARGLLFQLAEALGSLPRRSAA
ncbi:MAG TPA: disulfide oxidoreductase, partial [Rhodospirillaceae bacterium]|nr:disulfide oxidoreductase [Rhodospirillaceae bacterium]